jgi:hypothetical protein
MGLPLGWANTLKPDGSEETDHAVSAHEASLMGDVFERDTTDAKDVEFE